jgi:hypothetical protein
MHGQLDGVAFLRLEIGVADLERLAGGVRAIGE